MKKEYSVRKEIRLKNYDYSQNGLYFITICTKDKIPYLCEIESRGRRPRRPTTEIERIRNISKRPDKRNKQCI